MKHINRIFAILLLTLLFVACTDKDLVQSNPSSIKEGVPVTVSLDFGVSKSDIVSRSAQDDEVEQRVNRLFVIAFYANGNISGYKTYENLNNTTGKGKITGFEMHSGSGQKICMIANPSTGMGTLTVDVLEQFAKNGKTFDDFKDIYSQFFRNDDIETNLERMSFLMFGQMENTVGEAAMDVTEEGTIANYDGPVELERVDSRITFHIKTAEGITFTPHYYQVNNIPAGTYIYPQDKDYEEAGYQNMETEENSFTKNFDDLENAVGFEFYMLENRQAPTERLTSALIAEGGTYWDETEGKPEVQNLYALREKRKAINQDAQYDKEGQKYELGEYIYAPQQGTYVIITGELYFKNETDEEVYANVRYTVHLGNTGNSAEDGNNESYVNNYETLRNTHYTYTVTITGVNSIDVEVHNDIERRPGVEGDVVVAQGEVVPMDAHYGRKLFTLTRGQIKAGLSWAIKTPFQNGMKVFQKENYEINGKIATEETQLADQPALQTTKSLNDYKWVQFVINAETDRTEDFGGGAVPDDHFAKYPGHKAYNGGDEDSPAPAFGGNGYHCPNPNTYYTKDVKMYDVNQLLNHLYIEANKTTECNLFHDAEGNTSYAEDAMVTITAFIDEYVYIYNPNEVYYRAPNTKNLEAEDLALWKEVVNGDNRLLHICLEGAQYSPDGNSSWANSVITFSQSPIYTFYNPNANGVTEAWGTESINETGGLRIVEEGKTLNLATKPNTPDNGRQNTLNIINGELKWSNVLNREEDGYGTLKTGYNNIWYACLGRNRDIDGDNIVDAEEIRWYLASIDQLTDLWIGEEAVPNAVLYDVSKYVQSNTVTVHHVASSTYNNGAEDPWVIWAEEGASRGAKSGSSETNGEEYDYRCVRNLGIDLTDITKVPEDYVLPPEQSTYNGHNEIRLDVSRLNPEARRSPLQDGYLPPHNERDYNNRPYRKFAVCTDWIYPSNDQGSYWDRPGTLYYANWKNLYNGDIAESTACPPGYRIPNQRELMLLYTRIDSNVGLFSLQNSGGDYSIYMAKTAFGFNNYNGYNDRPGFGYDPDNLKLLDNGSYQYMKVRCVRDVVE